MNTNAKRPLTAYEKVTAALEAKHCRRGTGWDWQCPNHQDEKPSLGVTPVEDSPRESNGRTYPVGAVLVNCSAGCSTPDVLKTLELTERDLFPPQPRFSVQGGRRKLIQVYKYDNGLHVFRWEPKAFTQGHYEGDRWTWKTTPTTTLYNLKRVQRAIALEQPVWLVDGEKDVHALDRARVTATCCPKGMGNFTPEHAALLKGANVVVVQDRKGGAEQVAKVLPLLAGVAKQVAVKQSAEGNDSADHLHAGKGVEDFAPVDQEQDSSGNGEEWAPQTEAEGSVRVRERSAPGGDFILDGPDEPPALWGKGGHVIWAEDEGFLIVGPQGVGKSTIAQQVVLALLGIRPGELLGYPVRAFKGRVLYLAMDRPAQIRRSLRRMVSKDDRDALNSRLVVWKGPLPLNVVKEPATLADFFEGVDGITAVVVDSYKDLAPGLAQDEVGSAINLAMQEVIARGVQWLGLHHQRKATADNRKPNTLDDVYGSNWLTAGCGSVVLLWSKPGSPAVELTHLKQPAEPVGPLDVLHKHSTGESTVMSAGEAEFSIDIMLEQAGEAGVSERELALAVYGSDDRDSQKRIHRLLERRQSAALSAFDGASQLVRIPGARGGAQGGGSGARWVLKS